jgi:hypothetical protein
MNSHCFRLLNRASAAIVLVCVSAVGLAACASSTGPGTGNVAGCESPALHAQHFLASNEWPTVSFGLRLTNTASSSCTIPAEPDLAGTLSDGSSLNIRYGTGNSTPDHAVVIIKPGRSATTTITAVNGCALPSGGNGKISSVRITLGAGRSLTIPSWNQEIACGISAKPFKGNS